MRIPIRRLDPGLPLPAAQHDGDAGLDLYSATDLTLEPRGGRALVPTGIAIAIPPGFAGFVQPRSGLALRHGVSVVNTPGLVDAGYRDEIRVLLANIVSSVVAELAPAMRDAVSPNGRAVVSGILVDERAAVAASLAAAGWRVESEYVEGEWWSSAIATR